MKRPSLASFLITSSQQTARLRRVAGAFTLYVLCFLSIFGGSASAPALAQGTVEFSSFPPRDVRVSRRWLTSHTLRLRFEPSGSVFERAENAKPVTYLLAGSPASPPRARITALHLYRTRGREVVEETYELPQTLDPSTAFMRISDLGLFRQYRIYAFTVMLSLVAQPLLPNASEMWLADFLEFEVELGPPAPHTDVTASSDFAGTSSPISSLTNALLLNADLDPSYYVTSATQTWSDVRAWAERIRIASEHKMLFKATFYRPGIYRIARSDLEAALTSASLSASSLSIPPASTWRIYTKGQEISAIERPDHRDALLVVVPQWDIDEEGPAVYWIDASNPGTDSRVAAPLRATLQSPRPAPSNAEAVRVTCEAVFERLQDYQTRIRPTSEVTKWYWKAIAPETIATFDLELPQDFAPEGEVEFIVYSALSHSRQNLPQLELIARGDTLATASLAGLQTSTRFIVPARVLSPGTNEIGIRLHYADDSFEEKRDLLVQKLLVRWTQAAAPPPTTDFMVPAAAGKRHTLDLTTSPESLIVASLSPFRQWSAFLPAGQRTLFDDLPLGSPLQAVPANGLRGPSSIEVVTTRGLSLLSPDQGADYIAIVHPKLLNAAEPLLSHRAQQGLRVAQVNVEDVFDLFGFGQRTSQAIRKFLSYAFYEWPTPRVSYALLVGEASAYRRDPAEAPPNCEFDMIPTCGQVRTESVHGDHGYACVAGTDSIPDLLVGRLSVSAPDELTSAIAKLLRYEAASAGDWNQRALFVTDDNEEFPRVAAEVLRLASAPPLSVRVFNEADFLYVPNPRVYGKRYSREATRELLRALDSGLLFVNYFGHGGPNLWSHERLLHILDLPKLSEPARLPLIACASCDNAWLDYPVPPVQASMGEILVKQPMGGAVAVFAPVSGATSYEHEGLMTSLLEAMTRTPLRAVGELATYAKITYYAQTLSPAVPEQYVVVGDPALQIKVPDSHTTLTLEPRIVEAGRLTSLAVHALVDSPSITSASLRLLSVSTDEEILSRPVAVISGRANAIVTLDQLSPGPYAAVLEYEQEGHPYRAIGRFDAVESRIGLDQGKLLGLASRVVATTEAVSATISVFNPTPLDHLSATLDAALVSPRADNPTVYRIASDTFALAAAQARQYLFDWTSNLPQHLLIRWHQNGRENTRREFALDLPRATTQTSEALVAPYGAQLVAPAEATEFDTPTFACDIWNVGCEEVREALVTLFAQDEPLAQSQLLSTLSPAAKRQMIFVARKPLPAGITSVTLLIQRKDPVSSDSDHWLTLFERTDRVEIKRGAELEIVPNSVTVDVPPEGIIARTSVRVRALLKNSGESTARNIRIQLMIDDPTTGTAAVMLNEDTAAVIPEVPPGATVPIEARWENCTQPGSPRLWLVINGARTIKERDYSNNVALVPPFKVRPLGDFRLVALDYAPREASAGTSITIQCGVASDADIPRGPLDVEVGLRNPLSGKKFSQQVVINQIPSQTTVPVSVQFAYEPDFTEVYAIVNATKGLEESDSGGNEQSARIWPIILLPTSQQVTSPEELDLSRDFMRTVSHNVELVPGPALRISDTFTSSSGMTPVAPEWAVGGPFVRKPPSLFNDTDDMWSIAPWLIEANRQEHCAPLRLRVPVAPWLEGIPYEVYIYALCSNNYKGGRVGRFDVAVEDAPAVSVDFRAENPSVPIQRRYVGRYDLRDGFLDVTIAQTTGSGVVIKGVETVPAAGFVDSPIYVLDERVSKWTLKFADNDPAENAIRYWVREGRANASGHEWNDWRPVSGKTVTLQASCQLVQWRAVLYPTGSLPRPTLNKVMLRKEE